MGRGKPGESQTVMQLRSATPPHHTNMEHAAKTNKRQKAKVWVTIIPKEPALGGRRSNKPQLKGELQQPY